MKLLKCPFCGGEAELISETYHPAMSPVFVVRCLECLAHSSVLGNPERAVKAWNRRIK